MIDYTTFREGIVCFTDKPVESGSVCVCYFTCRWECTPTWTQNRPSCIMLDLLEDSVLLREVSHSIWPCMVKQKVECLFLWVQGDGTEAHPLGKCACKCVPFHLNVCKIERKPFPVQHFIIFLWEAVEWPSAYSQMHPMCVLGLMHLSRNSKYTTASCFLLIKGHVAFGFARFDGREHEAIPAKCYKKVTISSCAIQLLNILIRGKSSPFLETLFLYQTLVNNCQ